MSSSLLHLKQVGNQDGVAVLDMRKGVIATFNATGGYVWERLQQGNSVEEIVAALAQETDVPAHAIEADVRHFLTSLREHDLLDS